MNLIKSIIHEDREMIIKKVYFFNIFIQSRSAWKRGEIKLAREKSSISKDFIRASVCIGMFMYILILVAVLFIVILHVHS